MNFKSSLIYILVIISAFVVLKGCATESESENAVVLSGQALNESTGNVVPNAIVQITTPEELMDEVVTDSSGAFSFTFEIESSTDISLQTDKQGYETNTRTFRVAPGVDETDLVIELTPEGGSDDGGGDDEVGGEPEGAAAIVLEGVSNQAINIAETGDVVSSVFTFEVQDSSGRALNQAGAVDVQFSIISGPGGSEEIIPSTARTNSQGQVTTSLFSGNAAGPVKVQALVERPEVGLTIRSTPVLVAIHGGFPDENHFSIAPDKYNFEGYSFNNMRNPITVIVGDQFSNPVKPGTVVYFNTTGGVVQGSGETDEDGIVIVDLISGDPRPNDAITGSDGRPGYATVTASTVDENDIRIEKNVNIVFSTSDALISASPTTFDLPPNGGASFDYEVTDLNGNPMAAGTQIEIEAGDGIEVTGDNSLTLGNHTFPGPGATEFSFSIRDTDDETDDEADLTIKISVTSPSGNTTTYSGISGTRHKSW